MHKKNNLEKNMDNDHKQIGELLLKAELFSTCSRKDIVRILPFVEKNTYKEGEEIYKLGDAAERILLVVSGKIELKSDRRSVKIIETGSFGEESIRKDSKYLLNAVAV